MSVAGSEGSRRSRRPGSCAVTAVSEPRFSFRMKGTNAASKAERAARRASENALPRHFKSFVVATGVVLVGVGLVRTNAGERKQARSKLVRHALGLPERRTCGSED